MRMVALVENTSGSKALHTRHGLSIYIEANGRRALFDVGPSGDVLLHNAQKLGVDLAGVDTVVISHGHADHGGALEAFLALNRHAAVYVHREAFEPHLNRVAFWDVAVGLNPALAHNARITLTGGTLPLGDGLLLFSDADGHFDTKGNRALLRKTRHGIERDPFLHEQYLLVSEAGHTALFSGCSHRGIANILPAALRHCERVDAALGGFHLHNPSKRITEPKATVHDVAQALLAGQTQYYTCHCTGKKAFRRLRAEMGPRLHYFSTGTVLQL